jgi:hypothetical protein
VESVEKEIYPGDVFSSEGMDLERLRKMVSKTNGYYGRDYSLGLGWNNVSCRMCCRLCLV